ncbi:hypothetical protein RQ846_20065 [Roseomonas mucosa]|uniref:hypothetical protein n=1 Tax=Roseomonas mucosa TaxID=207340 RepID=UPI0028CBE072|nr:hypothetical protein [Roseomonas mucosa]MDT8292013.1 hypothetical protein [Roseomonas mucosa]
MDLTLKKLDEIERMILAHAKTDAGRSLPRYRELLEERARRHEADTQLSLDKSMEVLVRVASQGICTTYGELAKASGVPWFKARHRMNGNKGHLERLLDICHLRGIPLLTALCVNADQLASCELGEDSLRGFCEGARRLGYAFGDEREFHHKQRDASWDWGRAQSRAS